MTEQAPIVARPETETPAQGKNIIICCDGTGNEPRATANTNVFEVAGLARLEPGREGQIVYYDPGLGTDAAPGAQTWIAKKTTKILGLAFGYGLRKNIGDAYSFLMEHYEPGDRIYLFGFSRGAYTVRAIAGMLRAVGLMHRGCVNLLPYALELYLEQGGQRQWELEGHWKRTFCRLVPKPGSEELWFTIPIQFLGVWDTVKSVGLARKSVVLPYTDALPNVLNGRHALAIDERRSKFRPDLWTATGDVRGELRAAWFWGVHTDVGGGYREDEQGIADLSLGWMLEGAQRAGMVFDRKRLSERHEEKIGRWKLPLAQEMAKEYADDEAWAQVGPKLERAKNWTRTRWELFHADPLRAAGEELETRAAAKHEKVHESLSMAWRIVGWSRRPLPPRAWLHWSVKRRFDRMSAGERRALAAPLDLLARLEDGTRVVRDGSVVLVERGDIETPGDVLIQTLTREERKHLDESLPEEPEAALQALRVAGIKAWREEGLKAIADDARQEARELLEKVEAAVEERRFKGKDGALDLLTAFLRKKTIRLHREHIAATSPGLVDSLSECPVETEENA